eukprot:5643042-Pyramimonas_sp.AAC.1
MLSRRVVIESSATAAADAITRLFAVPTSSPAAQHHLHTPTGAVPLGANLPRHWEQNLRQRGRTLDRLARTECMAATETVWDGSIKAKTDLLRRQSCALCAAVTPIDEQYPCELLDQFRLRNAFPTSEGKMLLHLQWTQEFKILLRGHETGQEARTLLLSFTSPSPDQVASLKLLWPPEFGGTAPASECDALRLRWGTKYPSNECIVAYDKDKFGKFHADSRVPSPPEAGMPWYSLDKAAH